MSKPEDGDGRIGNGFPRRGPDLTFDTAGPLELEGRIGEVADASADYIFIYMHVCAYQNFTMTWPSAVSA